MRQPDQDAIRVADIEGERRLALDRMPRRGHPRSPRFSISVRDGERKAVEPGRGIVTRRALPGDLERDEGPVGEVHPGRAVGAIRPVVARAAHEPEHVDVETLGGEEIAHDDREVVRAQDGRRRAHGPAMRSSRACCK